LKTSAHLIRDVAAIEQRLSLTAAAGADNASS
jgi:hypothetical protein